jgi:hypothetical protein
MICGNVIDFFLFFSLTSPYGKIIMKTKKISRTAKFIMRTDGISRATVIVT